MDRLVLDSSVVIKWFVPEVDSDLASRLLERYQEGGLSLLVPDLLFVEIGNIVWKKCRIQQLEPEDGDAVMEAFQTLELEVTSTAELLEEAYRLATKHQRTVYDSAYIALSLREQVTFVTADRRLANAVGDSLPNVVALDRWSPP